MILAMLIHPESCNDDPRQSQCFFTLTGIGQSGLPSLEVPPFSVFRNVTENTTYNYEEINVDIHDQYDSFEEMISNIGLDIIIIPLIAIIENIAIAKSFGECSLTLFKHFVEAFILTFCIFSLTSYP